MEDLSNYFTMIEQCITELGIDAIATRGKNKPGQWTLKRGSAKVWIDCWYIEKQGRSYFQVMSPVMKIPTDPMKRIACYEELLRINDKLFGVAFTIYDKYIWLKTIREVENLDKSEIMAQITRIGNYADQYDDDLINKYGDPSDKLSAAEGGQAPQGPGPTQMN